jgi:hypothetical protein
VISVRDEAMALHKLSTVYAVCLREYAAILRSMDLSLANNLLDRIEVRAVCWKVE